MTRAMAAHLAFQQGDAVLRAKEFTAVWMNESQDLNADVIPGV